MDGIAFFLLLLGGFALFIASMACCVNRLKNNYY